MRDTEKMYLDYFNNYLTIQKFADDNNLSISEANKIINKGRKLNQKL